MVYAERMSDNAGIRKALEALPSVSRTWFEFERTGGDSLLKTLVVAVLFDTDPNSTGFNQSALDDIERIAIAAADSTTMAVHRLRIVPDPNP